MRSNGIEPKVANMQEIATIQRHLEARMNGSNLHRDREVWTNYLLSFDARHAYAEKLIVMTVFSMMACGLSAVPKLLCPIARP